MTQIRQAYGDLVVLLSPVLAVVLLAVFFARTRVLCRSHPYPRTRALLETVPMGFILIAAIVVLQPSPVTDGGIDWIPFDNLSPAGLRQIAGNLVLLMPVGFLLGLHERPSSLAAVLGIPLAVETVQFLADLGRVPSVEDVILGAAGILVGLAIAAPVTRLPVGARSRTP